MRMTLRLTVLAMTFATYAVAAPKAEKQKPTKPPRDDCAEFVAPMEHPAPSVAPHDVINENADPLGGVRRSKVDDDFDSLLCGVRMADGGIHHCWDTSQPPGLNKGDVMAVVAGHKDQIKRCINFQRSNAPAVTGTVSMHWVIEKTGDVSGAACNTKELENTVMAKCMRCVIALWKFPPMSSGPFPVDFPFKF